MSADRGIRRMTAAAVLVVAAIAAVVSFIHIEHLAVANGQTTLAALLLPVSVDGTGAAASLAMLWAARTGLSTPWLARVMVGLGVTATLAANADYGAAHGLTGELLSGWPAIAFVGSVEIALGMVRRTRKADMTAPTVAAGPAIEPARPPDLKRPAKDAKAAKPAARVAAIVAKTPDISGAELGRRLGVSERSGRRHLAALASTNGGASDEH
ncbi:MAG TPA: DUF2637 domain-containing protein [Streptosporangiaceae bacterium]|nr:DUF2637 domain-containing protein [Streptosporangiaceae bacterium]